MCEVAWLCVGWGRLDWGHGHNQGCRAAYVKLKVFSYLS